MSAFRRTALGLGIALLAVALAGPFLPKWATYLFTIATAKGLVALGLLLLMRTGLVSFGQGLYFGIGAYAAGLGADGMGLRDAVPMVLLGAGAAGLVAAVLGLHLVRRA